MKKRGRNADATNAKKAAAFSAAVIAFLCMGVVSEGGRFYVLVVSEGGRWI